MGTILAIGWVAVRLGVTTGGSMLKGLVAVHQFDGCVKLLKIDLATGAREVVPSDVVMEDEVGFGFFEIETINTGLSTVALMATPAGPLLFLNELRYYPDVERSKIDIQDHKNFSTFTISHGERRVFEFSYEEKFGIGLHPYNNSREDIDFYYWLGKYINNPQLHEKYSREITYTK